MDQHHQNANYRGYGPDKSPLRSPMRSTHSAGQNNRAVDIMSSIGRGSNSGSNMRIMNPREEEELYNRRRQEEISRASNSSGQFLHPQLKPQSPHFHQQQMRPSQDRGSIRDSITPTSHFTLGQQQHQPQQSSTLPFHVREHLSHLQNDNASLMRRLNLVHQELERINREKADLQSQFTHWSKHAQEAHELLQTDDNVDRVNKYMKDDLIYEKERNLKLQGQISELNTQIINMADEVKQLEHDQELMIRQNQETTYITQKQTSQIGELEKEQYFNQERIKDLHYNIEKSRIECQETDTTKYQMRQTIELVMAERNDLIDRVTALSRQFDETVRQITEERQLMDIQNSRHAKFVTAKVIHNLLSQFHKSKLHHGFKEIVTYTNFDSKCNLKLKQLAKLLEKAGETKLRITLNHWFSSALKPTEAKTQSNSLSKEAGDIRIVVKFFGLWREEFRGRIKVYEQKTQAVRAIWSRFVEEARIEKQRSFQIWKEQFNRFRLQKYRMKKLLWRKLFKQETIALAAWKNNDSYFDTQMRLGLLCQNFTHKQYLAIMFHHLLHQAQNNKRVRLSKQRHILKAWKDYLAYQKFLMSQSILATRFHSENFTSVIQACFDGWKAYKQSQKFKKSHAILHTDELERIRELTDGNNYLLAERHRLNTQRACDAIKVCFQKRLWSYINHWRLQNVHYHDAMKTSVQDKLIRLLMSHERVSFQRWKRLHSQNKLSERQNENIALQSQQLQLQNEVISVSNSNTEKQNELQQQRQRHLLKCIEGFECRFRSIAVGRWRDQANDMRTKEDGAYTIMRRLRLRLVRKAFDLYLAGLAFQRKVQVQEERCRMYNRLRDKRLKATVLNAWTIFKTNHLTAKDYWYRIFLRLEVRMKQLSVKKWIEVTQLKVEKSLKSHESQIIDKIEDLNHNIGELHQKETDQKIEIQDRKLILTTQGQRILSNSLARFHWVNLTRGFEKWREYIEFDRNKERLLEIAVTHIKKSQFYVVKATFKNWMQTSDIVERQSEVKRETMRVNDTIFQTKLQQEHFIQQFNHLNQNIQEENTKSALLQKKLQNTVQLIVKRVNENHYTSQRRYIFDQWSDYVRREVYFINCIKTVFTKSLLNDGFQSIKNASREHQKSICQEDVLVKFFQTFNKHVLTNALSAWRRGNFTEVKQVTIDTLRETEARENHHNQLKDKLKTHNAFKAEKFLIWALKKNSYVAWRNISRHLKIHREKTILFLNEKTAQNQRQAIIKWRGRYQVTKERRTAFKRLRVKVQTKQMRTYFKAMQEQFYKYKELMSRLSNLATVCNHQALQQSMNSIKSFSRAKSFVYNKRIENSTIWLAEALNGILLKKKHSYLTSVRIRCLNKRKVDTIKKLTVSLNASKCTRAYFQRWREQSQLETVAREQSEEGLIRIQEAQFKAELKNIKEMMTQEGYDEVDISKAEKEFNQRQRALMIKAVQRLKHFNSRGYVVPKMFDRWRMYIHAKKQWRYWLAYIEKRRDYIKTDLHIAFEKWRKRHQVHNMKLTVQSKADLNRKAVLNSKELDNLSENIIEKENIIDHLNAQRETLLDNYIKGQKLVLSLWVNRHRNALHQAFLQWNGSTNDRRNFDSSSVLQRNLQTLEALKSRIAQFETQNEVMANENEELRQFSLDGYEIAKSVQALSAEREILSVDLADKAQVIKKLLDENELLSRKLHKAQEQASTMIRSTMKRDSRVGSAGVPIMSRSIRS